MKIYFISFIGILFVLCTQFEETESLNSSLEIVVGYSRKRSFMSEDLSGGLKGLDVLILENFAKRFKLKVKYMEYNLSIQEILKKGKYFEDSLLNRKIQ